MEPRGSRIRRIVSWFVVIEGLLLSTLVIAVIGGEPPWMAAMPGVILGMVVGGLVPLVASLVATCNLRVAARIDLWVAPIAFLFVLALHGGFGWGFAGIPRSVAAFAGAVVVPGFFYRWAARRNWPPPLANSHLLRRPRLAVAIGASFGCVLVAVTAGVGSLSVPWFSGIDDCNGRPLVDEKGMPSNIDFTAKAVFVGPRTYDGYSLWAIARVEERFPGVQWRVPNLIILRGGFQSRDMGQEYFVEGARGGSISSRLLPVIYPVACGHSRRLQSAAVELRILRERPPKLGPRLIGCVYRERRVNPTSPTPVPGASVSIEGPSGRIVILTDAEGIYDAAGLTPGEYTVRLASGDAPRSILELRAGELLVHNLYIP
jgi:hypothetical protein